MSSATCQNCRFYKEPTREERAQGYAGECRRRAPTKGGVSHWPIVCDGDWCGDFEAKVVLT